ncbi:MAG: hypothetical protein ACR2FN_01540 [Chitinophagaceae bacterium]
MKLQSIIFSFVIIFAACLFSECSQNKTAGGSSASASDSLDSARQILPPMPWQFFKNMNDGELKAIFAYLKSTKPIHNVVPQAALPVTAMK